MFDIFAKLLSSIASFLFPLFASYKALKTSDPAQLTPWLMYWVVLACALLVESWTEWFLVWIPFYAYIRLLFLLYLVLPQTQGARIIYQNHVHPWLEENESSIEDFIASAHDRLRSAGISYLKRAIDIVKTSVLGLPPSQERPAPLASAAGYGGAPQSYTQSLLARFSLPSARWTGGGGGGTGGGNAGTDLYSLLTAAVNAATGSGAAGTGAGTGTGLVPDDVRGASDRVSFLAAQRERLSVLLSALEREESQLRAEGDGTGSQTPPARHAEGGGLSKSRSEADFEKLEAESGAEEDMDDAGSMRRRGLATPSGGSWMPWGWGGAAGGGSDVGRSSGLEQ